MYNNLCTLYSCYCMLLLLCNMSKICNRSQRTICVQERVQRPQTQVIGRLRMWSEVILFEPALFNLSGIELWVLRKYWYQCLLYCARHVDTSELTSVLLNPCPNHMEAIQISKGRAKSVHCPNACAQLLWEMFLWSHQAWCSTATSSKSRCLKKHGASICVPCLTKWSVRAPALHSIHTSFGMIDCVIDTT